MVTSPTRIKRVSVADPAIADAIVVSPNQVLVNGKIPGGVSLMLWDDSDQSQAFEVSVDIDILSLSEKIHEVFPNEQVQIETSKDSVILSGHASSTAVADKIMEVVKNATPKVTSLIVTPAVQPGEILLEVKFAEVDRSAVSQFGINILSLPGAKNVGSITTQEFGPPSLTGTLSQNGVTGNNHQHGDCYDNDRGRRLGKQSAQHFPLPAGPESGGDDPGAATTEHSADPGGA